MFDLTKIVRDNIKALTPYSSARDEFKGKEGVFLDANENPFGKYNRYPDPYQRELKRVISGLKKVEEENIFLGNGSDEIIDLLFTVFCNPGKDVALTLSPTYGMYEVSAGINDVELVSIPLKYNFQMDLKKVKSALGNTRLKLIFICSPNNPTGNSMDESNIDFILNNFNGIVVIDEAYIDFSPQRSWSALIRKYPNLVVMQTLSKAWGLAGARLGMAFANCEIIAYLNKVKPPYNVSALNQEIAVECIQHKEDIEDKVKLILTERTKIEKQLAEINLVEKIYHSDANFLLVKVTDADKIYDELIEKNLVVRNRNNVIVNCLRITIGTPEENERLISELNKIAHAKSIIYR